MILQDLPPEQHFSNRNSIGYHQPAIEGSELKIDTIDKDIFNKVKKIIVDKLSVDDVEVTPGASFTEDLGADSLDIVELIMEFEKVFNISILDEEAETITTVGHAVFYLQDVLKHGAHKHLMAGTSGSRTAQKEKQTVTVSYSQVKSKLALGNFKLRRELTDSLFPDDVLYSKEHHWIKAKGKLAFIGLTSFAQRELGDIVYIEIKTVRQKLNAGEVFGTLEAVKTVSDLYLPVACTILKVNPKIGNEPQLVNKSPYVDGWLVVVEVTNPAELKELLKAGKYKELVNK